MKNQNLLAPYFFSNLSEVLNKKGEIRQTKKLKSLIKKEGYNSKLKVDSGQFDRFGQNLFLIIYNNKVSLKAL